MYVYSLYSPFSDFLFVPNTALHRNLVRLFPSRISRIVLGCHVSLMSLIWDCFLASVVFYDIHNLKDKGQLLWGVSAGWACSPSLAGGLCEWCVQPPWIGRGAHEPICFIISDLIIWIRKCLLGFFPICRYCFFLL